VEGRKIHALVDSEGLPMRVVIHSAAIQDRDGAGLVLNKLRRRFPRLELIWADGGYNGRREGEKFQTEVIGGSLSMSIVVYFWAPGIFQWSELEN